MAKSVRWLGVMVMSLGLLACLAACAPDAMEDIVPTAPSATLQPEPAAPQEDVALPPTPGPEREDAGEVVAGFYQWYLDYEGSPLAEGAYRDHPVISPEFAQAVQDRLDSFESGGYDPILCAQDLPDAVEIGTITISGDSAEVMVTTSFSGHNFRVLLAAQDQGWQITDVVCAAEGAADPAGDIDASAGGPRQVVPDWPVLVDERWGFVIQYPEGWMTEEVDLDDPSKPPAGKMARLTFFVPEGWDEDYIALQMDVYDMDDEAFGMEFPPATSEEEVVRDDGVTYIKAAHEFGENTMVQYLFRHPMDPDVRVVFTDYVSGWPGRLAGNEDVVAAYEPMLQSFGFTE